MSARRTSKNRRLGRCYELSAKHVLEYHDDVLVHGIVMDPSGMGKYITIAHAWIEFQDGTQVYDPVMDQTFLKEVYYQIYEAKAEATYTLKQLCPLLVTTKHYGPWHTEDPHHGNTPRPDHDSLEPRASVQAAKSVQGSKSRRCRPVRA